MCGVSCGVRRLECGVVSVECGGVAVLRFVINPAVPAVLLEGI
jgi:hypothetical protein